MLVRRKIFCAAFSEKKGVAYENRERQKERTKRRKEKKNIEKKEIILQQNLYVVTLHRARTLALSLSSLYRQIVF